MKTEKIFSYSSGELVFTRRVTECPGEKSFPMHIHPQIELVLSLSGNSGYIVDGERVKLNPYDLIVIAPGIPHKVDAFGEKYERVSVVMHPSLLPNSATEELRRSFYRVSLSRSDEICRLLEKAERYYSEIPSESHGRIYPALAIELFYLLLSRISENTSTDSEIVNRAISYIDSHFTEMKGISELCERLYVSKSYLHALFHEHTGKTPLADLSERRLHLANARIAAGAKPTTVFRECGFCDYTSFYRAYKKLYGRAPSDISRVNFTENEF